MGVKSELIAYDENIPISFMEISSDSCSSNSSSSDSVNLDYSIIDHLHTELGQKRQSEEIDGSLPNKKPKTTFRFLDDVPPVSLPLPVRAVPISVISPDDTSTPTRVSEPVSRSRAPIPSRNKQFWKAGEYEGNNSCCDDVASSADSAIGLDRSRVHPKFLHSNATSHKWALGAIAELLDNALDEACNGATYVHIDMMRNSTDGAPMLIIQDNGGGMDSDTMRQCMSFGFSEKSKMENVIGQYGNGFKAGTMRLGADVIVFSLSQGRTGQSPTRSIGMLSYTFLMSTGKKEIVVPMIDFEKKGKAWKRSIRTSPNDWDLNYKTILKWSPYATEDDLNRQFDLLGNQGTQIVIYNLWEEDEGKLELDFDADPYDIQLRGVNRDEKKIEMAKTYPNSKHYFTYRHSLRSYASILYLRLPRNFKMILRGKDVEHHNIVKDMMMLVEELTYKPVEIAEGTRNANMVAAPITLGFVKDAHHHIDVQGFNVYHKNRLIKPFWRVWNAAGSDGRGVVGVLEADFFKPTHDKQSFERTSIYARLEKRLIKFQKHYWSTRCQEVGYAARRAEKKPIPDAECVTSKSNKEKPASISTSKMKWSNGETSKTKHVNQTENRSFFNQTSINEDAQVRTNIDIPSEVDNPSETETEQRIVKKRLNRSELVNIPLQIETEKRVLSKRLKQDEPNILHQTETEQPDSTERSSQGAQLLEELLCERERCQTLELKLKEAEAKCEMLDKEHVALIDIFQAEKEAHEKEKEALEKEQSRLMTKLTSATNMIDRLCNKVKALESKMPLRSCKEEH